MGFGEDNDSGMSSQNSKSETPEKVLAIEGSGDDYEDEVSYHGCGMNIDLSVTF